MTMTAQTAETMPRRVLITGATGFIGGRLCEVLALSGICEARAFVHSTGSAARIGRLPIDFAIGDLCDRKSVVCAIEGCDAVVHLARGARPVMTAGLGNVLRAARDHGVSRFVHVSSVAVYGNRPPAESVSEEAPARRTESEYGNEKLAQERQVLRCRDRYRLPAVILRPPNVYGPFSPFTLGLLKALRAGSVALVDGGHNPCNLVYVDNLIEAILLSLWRREAVGETFFVTDTAVPSWAECIHDHAALCGLAAPSVGHGELVRQPAPRVFRDSLRMLPRVLASGELRTILRQVPLIKRAESTAYELFQKLSQETRERVRFRLTGPRPALRASQPVFSADDNIISAQGRTVRHSAEKARRLLDYSAPVSYSEGMALTEAWLRYSRII